MKTKWIVNKNGDLEKVSLDVLGPYETNTKNTVKKKFEPTKGIGSRGGQIKHGTVGGYKYYKCRCKECTTAITKYQKQFTQSQEIRNRRNAKKREKRLQERLDKEFLKK